MIGSGMIQALRPGRSNTASSSASTPDSIKSALATSSPSAQDISNSYCESNSAQARSSIDSQDSLMDDIPPPSYEEVVSDTSYVPNEFLNVRHYESYRNRNSRKNQSKSHIRFVEYGVQSSKIYTRD